jgi:hypothetical protein
LNFSGGAGTASLLRRNIGRGGGDEKRELPAAAMRTLQNKRLVPKPEIHSLQHGWRKCGENLDDCSRNCDGDSGIEKFMWLQECEMLMTEKFAAPQLKAFASSHRSASLPHLAAYHAKRLDFRRGSGEMPGSRRSAAALARGADPWRT